MLASEISESYGAATEGTPCTVQAMDKTAQVVHPRSLLAGPLHNILVVLGTLVDSSPILPLGNPARMENKVQINVYRSKICMTKDFRMRGTYLCKFWLVATCCTSICYNFPNCLNTHEGRCHSTI
jgi:hypothetical protein